ncbi:MAG: SPOR domain-containing protein [Treponema sp.]|nr:SPOR domain-containing protein [Treponema sp.]
MFLFRVFFVFSQNSLSLEAEIRNIEQKTHLKDSGSEQKHDAYVQLANLRQLSGDYEGAAKNWLEAAAAIPGSIDDDALFSCALCLAVTGEWERASKALEPLLFKSANARFLEACILAWKSGDISALSSIVNLNDYENLKTQIYFMLWKATGSDSWKQRLISEFPESPEAGIASDETSMFSIKINSLWLYVLSRDVFTQMENITRNITQAVTAAPVEHSLPVSQPGIPLQTAPAPAARTPEKAVETARRLQTGLFSKQANADDLAAKLRKAGFNPSLEQRIVNGNIMWAVTVPAGKDVNISIRELREAGFDSFPVK